MIGIAAGTAMVVVPVLLLWALQSRVNDMLIENWLRQQMSDVFTRLVEALKPGIVAMAGAMTSLGVTAVKAAAAMEEAMAKIAAAMKEAGATLDRPEDTPPE